MRNKLFFALFAAASIMLLSSPVKAIGMGGYVTGSYSYYQWEYNSEYYSYYHQVPDVRFNSNGYKIGTGFIFDTGIANDRLFNYRLQIGVNKVKMYNNHSDIPNVDGYEYSIYNNFCFGFIRTPMFRIWAGPQFGFGFFDGTYDVKTESTYPDEDSNYLSTTFASIGLIAGINIHFDYKLSLGIDGGFRYKYHSGDAGIDRNTYWEEIKGREYETFIELSVLFRLNDQYESNTAASN
ncbi:MAG: hypothetical protein V1874_13250 [Spirochaetota bacterium]